MRSAVNPGNLIIKEMRMKPVLNALTLMMVGVGLSGCGYLFGEDGYFRDRGSDYQTATIEPRMTVPPELQSKPIGDLLPVPGEVRAGSTGKYKVPRPQGMATGIEYSEYSMQQNGGERWLLAQHGTSAMWPRVRQFLNDYRVPVARESATLGELETGWLGFDVDADPPLVRRQAPYQRVVRVHVEAQPAGTAPGAGGRSEPPHGRSGTAPADPC